MPGSTLRLDHKDAAGEVPVDGDGDVAGDDGSAVVEGEIGSEEDI